MKTLIAISMGAVLGSALTYVAMKSLTNSEPQTHAKTEEVIVGDTHDAFGEDHEAAPVAEDQEDPFNQDRKAHGYGLMNMKDPFERDLCISFWYHDMFIVVKNLELHTGHTFNKKVGKLYAGPEEILEEQMNFMKSYLAETERIAKARKEE